MGRTAGDIMTKTVITVHDDTSINDLVGLFLRHTISCAPVLDADNELIGIVTKTDILSHFMEIDLEMSLNVDLKDIFKGSSMQRDVELSPERDLLVRDIMTPDPIIESEHTPIESLAKTMIEKNIHRLLIMKDNVIVGIISTLDILYHVAGIEKNG